MKKIPARVLADALEQIVDRKFEYEPKEAKPIDWSSYNRAKVQEISGVLDLIKNYVDDVEEYELPKKPVNKIKVDDDISVHDKAKAVLITEYMQADERTASGWVNILGSRVGIGSQMSPRTIGRAYYDDRVRALISLVFKKSSAAIQGLETSFSGDSTGIKKNNKVHYSRDKLDDEKKKDFAVSSIMVSNKYHVATALIFHESGPINDAPTLQGLWEQTTEIHGDYIEKAQFDAGFISRDNTQLIANSGATPYIFPKRNLTLKPEGKTAWRDMIHDCATNTQEWLREYHARSNVETRNSCDQRKFTKPLNCKDGKGQETEEKARTIIENFCQLNTAHYEEGLDLTPKYVT